MMLLACGSKTQRTGELAAKADSLWSDGHDAKCEPATDPRWVTERNLLRCTQRQESVSVSLVTNSASNRVLEIAQLWIRPSQHLDSAVNEKRARLTAALGPETVLCYVSNDDVVGERDNEGILVRWYQPLYFATLDVSPKRRRLLLTYSLGAMRPEAPCGEKGSVTGTRAR